MLKKKMLKKNRIKEGRIELMNQGLPSNELKTEGTMKKITKQTHARIFSRSKIQKQWESSLQKGTQREHNANTT